MHRHEFTKNNSPKLYNPKIEKKKNCTVFYSTKETYQTKGQNYGTVNVNNHFIQPIKPQSSKFAKDFSRLCHKI